MSVPIACLKKQLIIRCMAILNIQTNQKKFKFLSIMQDITMGMQTTSKLMCHSLQRATFPKCIV